MKSVCLMLGVLLSFSTQANVYHLVADKEFRIIENSLTINIIPSTYPLEWAKPRDLLFSLIKNKYYFPKTSSTLGHVNAEINCTVDGKRQRKFIGQSVKDLNGFNNYILNGYGFSILNRPHLYKDLPLLTIAGKLDDAKESYTKFSELIKKENFAALSFHISSDSCQRLIDFANEYEVETKETEFAGNRYGFGASPKNFSGAGCATMVQNLFNIAKLPKFAELMERQVYLPKEMIGNPEKGREVSLYSLFTEGRNMSKEDANLQRFSFPDPQNLYDFWASEGKSAGFNSFRVLKKGTFGTQKAGYLVLETLKAH